MLEQKAAAFTTLRNANVVALPPPLQRRTSHTVRRRRRPKKSIADFSSSFSWQSSNQPVEGSPIGCRNHSSSIQQCEKQSLLSLLPFFQSAVCFPACQSVRRSSRPLTRSGHAIKRRRRKRRERGREEAGKVIGFDGNGGGMTDGGRKAKPSRKKVC